RLTGSSRRSFASKSATIFSQAAASASSGSPASTSSSTKPASATASASWVARMSSRSEEHTSELQSRENLVCRLLLEKKKAGRGAADHRKTASPMTAQVVCQGRLHAGDRREQQRDAPGQRPLPVHAPLTAQCRPDHDR